MALVAANLLLAFGPWLVRLADVGPVAAGFWRLALALPVLVAAALLTRVPGRPAASRGAWIGLALGGVFFAGDLALWHAGILHTRLANATLFGNIASFAFPVYAFVVARAWPGRMQMAALLLAAIGTALLLGRSYDLSARNLLGDLLCLGAGLLYTAYFVVVERARGTVRPLPALAMVTAAGTLPLLLMALALGERVMPGNWWPVVALALGSQLIGQGLMVYAIGVTPPLVVGLCLLIQPVVAATVGSVVYGERLGVIDLTGMAVIAVALVLVRRRAVLPAVPTS